MTQQQLVRRWAGTLLVSSGTEAMPLARALPSERWPARDSSVSSYEGQGLAARRRTIKRRVSSHGVPGAIDLEMRGSQQGCGHRVGHGSTRRCVPDEQLASPFAGCCRVLRHSTGSSVRAPRSTGVGGQHTPAAVGAGDKGMGECGPQPGGAGCPLSDPHEE